MQSYIFRLGALALVLAAIVALAAMKFIGPEAVSGALVALIFAVVAVVKGDKGDTGDKGDKGDPPEGGNTTGDEQVRTRKTMPSVGRYGMFGIIAAALGAMAAINVACGHTPLKVGQYILHLASGDCAEVAHIHSGSGARTTETFCSALEEATEMNLVIYMPDGGIALPADSGKEGGK